MVYGGRCFSCLSASRLNLDAVKRSSTRLWRFCHLLLYFCGCFLRDEYQINTIQSRGRHAFIWPVKQKKIMMLEELQDHVESTDMANGTLAARSVQMDLYSQTHQSAFRYQVFLKRLYSMQRMVSHVFIYGGKAIIHEMPPFKAEVAVANLVKGWTKLRLDRLKEQRDKNLQQEVWNPLANQEAGPDLSMCRVINRTRPPILRGHHDLDELLCL